MMKNNIQAKQQFRDDYLTERGLNIHAIIGLDSLPEKTHKSIQNAVEINKSQQLIVIGHLGQSLWDAVQKIGVTSKDPIDNYSRSVVHEFFKAYYPDNKYQMLYPGDSMIDLQQIGKLAGWHYASPFKIGINSKWGSWFAYRAVIIADTNFEFTQPLMTNSPCGSCSEKYCIKSCPAEALSSGVLNLNQCISYRKQKDSICRSSCNARVSCPVGEEFRYLDEQIQYHYGVSMKTIEEYY